MKKINLDIKCLIGLWIILFVLALVTYANHGNLIIDSGREAYYPMQVLAGKVLYKDIFNIYGPFAYMFNAFLFKVFSINLNVLYLSGIVCSYLIVSFIYLIARKFLSSFLSFAVGFYTIAIGVTNLCLFNFMFPYSYAMLYGIVSFLISLWAILKYHENGKNIHFLYIASFMAGLCIANKYEFLPFALVILYASIKNNKLSLKQWYYNILALLFVPVFCFGILFLQGLHFSNLLVLASYIQKMAYCKTLRYFYITQGVYFYKLTPILLFSNLLIATIPLVLYLVGYKFKNRFIRIVVIGVASIVLFYSANPVTLCFLPVATVCLLFVSRKKLIQKNELLILALSAILISLKVAWGLATFNYGVFFASIIIVAFLALLFNLLNEEDIKKYSFIFGIYLIVLAFSLGIANISKFGAKSEVVKTQRGGIFTTYEYYKSTMDLIDYINKNTLKSDKIVILPEGAMINFLTDRQTDDYYTSLIPLYVETFGEKNIINHYKQTKPEYIIFNNWDTSDYYYKYICKDYAMSFCNYVSANYIKVDEISSDFNYLIYKKK